MGRKIARTVCAIIMLGVLLLCQVHAAIQLITGRPLDSGDWIGIASFGLIALMAISHLKCLRKKVSTVKTQASLLRPRKSIPSNRTLRESMPEMQEGSETLIREDRDAL
jgi:hypothetical protein